MSISCNEYFHKFALYFHLFRRLLMTMHVSFLHQSFQSNAVFAPSKGGKGKGGKGKGRTLASTVSPAPTMCQVPEETTSGIANCIAFGRAFSESLGITNSSTDGRILYPPASSSHLGSNLPSSKVSAHILCCFETMLQSPFPKTKEINGLACRSVAMNTFTNLLFIFIYFDAYS